MEDSIQIPLIFPDDVNEDKLSRQIELFQAKLALMEKE